MVGNAPIVPPRRAYRSSVWHYTSAAGLTGILASDAQNQQPARGVLHATAATSLNDLTELRYGVERIKAWYNAAGNGEEGTAAAHLAIRSVLKNLEQSVLAEPAYVVCASKEGDSLGQWRGYAGDGGYAMRIDTAQEYFIVGQPSSRIGLLLSPQWVEVAYNSEEQDSIIREQFDYILDSRSVIGRLIAGEDPKTGVVLVSGLLSGLAAALKHPSFKEEREVRLIAFRPTDVIPRFRPSSRGPVPYIQLVPSIWPSVIEPPRLERLAVDAVRIGPPQGEAAAQRERGVRALLDATGRTRTQILHSQIPFLP